MIWPVRYQLDLQTNTFFKKNLLLINSKCSSILLSEKEKKNHDAHQIFATVGIKRGVGEVISTASRLASKMPNLSTWEGEKSMLSILPDKRAF